MLKNFRNNGQAGTAALNPLQENPRDILSINPAFMERMALPFFTLILVVIITVGSSIHYPEVLKARAVFVDVNGVGGYSVKIELPQGNFARINTGQIVQFNFDEFSYENYGSVKGILQYVYNVESPGNITAKVYFPQGLKTSKGHVIPYSNGLKADVLIVIKDMRLLQHLFYNRSRTIRE
ncbi:hypothetical protein ACX0G9_30575 [Flavitalea flava]